MTDSGKIAPTAHYTAYAWHVLGLPNAELFATTLGHRLFRAYRLLELGSTLRGRPSRLLTTLDNRHALMDRELARLAPDVTVELGAGLSRRGLTWAQRALGRYVELDLLEMIAYKHRLFDERATSAQKAVLGERLRLRAADVMDPGFAELLGSELSGAERPLVIAEGLVGYFERPAQLQLLTAVRQALSGRGSLLLDLRVKGPSRNRATRALRFGIWIATRGRGAADSFENEGEIRTLLAQAGFTNVQQVKPLHDNVLSSVWLAR